MLPRILWGIDMSYNERRMNKEVINLAISETDQEWINKQGTENVGVTVEMVTEWFGEVIEELKTIGLDVALGCKEGEALTPAFIEMVKTGVMGKIQANITVEPTEFQLMMLGPYPERHINKKPSVEMVAFASMDGGQPEISTVSAWRELVGIKNEVEPLASYQTGVSFFKDDRIAEPKRFKLTVQGATSFSMDSKTDFMGASYDDKLASLRAVVPSVELGKIEQNLSRLKKSKNEKSYSDTLDLKKITVMVVGTAEGVDKNGRSWAMFNVIDGSFKPTVKVKNVTVWVDPSIFERLQAGEGSYLEIYGVIQKNNDGSTSMNTCFVHPLAIKPLERKENQAQIDQPGGTTVPPEEPQIQVMASGGM